MDELKKFIKKLKKRKAPGVDGYPAEIFKKAGEGLLRAILHLFGCVYIVCGVPRSPGSPVESRWVPGVPADHPKVPTKPH
jgi:hypothetical protein